MTDEIAAIVRGLSKAQREALIECVDALAELAGEGYCVAEDAIFNLFEAFHGDSSLEYGPWVRTAFSQDTREG